MRNQVRVLCLAAVLAMAAGWLSLHRGNDQLARQVPAPATEGRTP